MSPGETTLLYFNLFFIGQTESLFQNSIRAMDASLERHYMCPRLDFGTYKTVLHLISQKEQCLAFPLLLNSSGALKRLIRQKVAERLFCCNWSRDRDGEGMLVPLVFLEHAITSHETTRIGISLASKIQNFSIHQTFEPN